jgi:hypothetical protein
VPTVFADVVGIDEFGNDVLGIAVVGIAKLIEVIRARLSAHSRFDATTSTQ